MSQLVRQGEILLLPMQDALFGERSTVRRYVVGHSESGHHHVLDCDREFDIIVSGDEVLIDLRDTARLIHEAAADRHRTLDVAPGVYKVLRKQAYDPHRDEYGDLAD